MIFLCTKSRGTESPALTCGHISFDAAQNSVTILLQRVDVSDTAAYAEGTDVSILGGVQSLSNQNKVRDLCSMHKCCRQLFLKKIWRYGLHCIIG